jgi:PPOX class probable F420-dependent enzyme
MGNVLDLRGPCAPSPATRRLEPARPVTRSSADMSERLRPLGRSRFCRVTTVDPGGTAHATTARFGLDGERVLVRATSASDLASRVWHASRVTVSPCTRGGRIVGPPVEGAARVVSAHEEQAAQSLLEASDRTVDRVRLLLAQRRGLELLYVEILPR